MSVDGPWTIQRLLAWTQTYFAERGLDSPRLDAEVLLAEVLGCDRIYLYTHFDKPLDQDERSRYRAMVKRRAAREPVAHILGRREFFSRDFLVTRDVLVPRPETEHLIEAVLDWHREVGLAAPRILDIGTGCGNIAVVLASEIPEARLVATDISEAALAVARQNIRAHRVGEQIEVVSGDLFAPVQGLFDVVVSNPPYVDTGSRPALQPEVRDHEPAVALFAGEQGLDVIDRLCAEVQDHVAERGLFVCELDPGQYHHVAAALGAQSSWSEIRVIKDLQQLDRAVMARR